MNHPGEPHSLSNVQHDVPMLQMPLAANQQDFERDAHEIDLKGYFNILYDSRWLIGSITMLVTALAVVYALVASPVFEANLMIHVEEESPNASKNILSEVSSLFETKKAAIAEMELLRSRMVISHAVDNLQLFVDVRPRYFPVVGFWFADRSAGELSEPGIFGYGGYVWGPERADISVFDIPEAWQNREFTITARGDGRYLLGGQACRSSTKALSAPRSRRPPAAAISNCASTALTRVPAPSLRSSAARVWPRSSESKPRWSSPNRASSPASSKCGCRVMTRSASTVCSLKSGASTCARTWRVKPRKRKNR